MKHKMGTVTVTVMLLAALISTAGCAKSDKSNTTAQTAITPSIDATTSNSAFPVPSSAPSATSTGTFTIVAPDRSNFYQVQLNLVPDKTVYMPGETITMQVTLKNDSGGTAVNPIVVSSPSIVIIAPGGVPGNEKVVKTVGIGDETKTLSVGEQITFTLTWDQKDDNGKQVIPGWYSYSGNFNETINGQTLGSSVTNRAFLIQYPQGAMQKTIDVNQSQTITGFSFIDTSAGKQQTANLVVTLEQVQLTEKGLIFSVLVNSPDNPLEGYNGWGGIGGQAQYEIDGVTNNQIWYPNVVLSDEGIKLTWGSNDAGLEPIPNGSKQLTLIITQIGNWQGHMEFQVPLD
jgi:hypothetical protein